MFEQTQDITSKLFAETFSAKQLSTQIDDMKRQIGQTDNFIALEENRLLEKQKIIE